MSMYQDIEIGYKSGYILGVRNWAVFDESIVLN
jgi:hypothetical protein